MANVDDHLTQRLVLDESLEYPSLKVAVPPGEQREVPFVGPDGPPIDRAVGDPGVAVCNTRMRFSKACSPDIAHSTMWWI